MKIIVQLEVEIADPADWTVAFGVEGAAEIRKDIKRYVRGLAEDGGVLGNGEVRSKVTLKNP